MPTDLEIARRVTLRPIDVIADQLAIPRDALQPYGRHIAKLDSDWTRTLADRPHGKLVLVTAISPTPAGEGKTTTTIGLGDALRRLGRRVCIALREPSLGPCFGQKGGATGGGHAQVAPMERINLHFTGDFHAITSANNLLAAMLDNHLHWGNALGIDARRVRVRRVIDMNDRALRDVVVGLGGSANGHPRQEQFDITVASEVMAIFCLARDLDDLAARLGRMVVAETHDRRLVRAAELGAVGAMCALLRDAFMPNLVQTLEGTPALVHGGPFANIAHGCNSVVATDAALRLADVVVTEAGFGADLGAEKFIDIKARQSGLNPHAAVIVATIRALKMHGGVARAALDHEDVAALERGFANLARHVTNLRRFGLAPIVAINRFGSDTPAESARLLALCADELGVPAHLCSHWADGGAGATALAQAVLAALDAQPVSPVRPLYPDELPLLEKLRHVAQTLYGAADLALEAGVARAARAIEAAGYRHLPICVAKTQYSFSADASALGAPTGHRLPVRELRLSAGAGFVVALCGEIMTMPGLPRRPAAEDIGLDAAGQIIGLS